MKNYRTKDNPLALVGQPMVLEIDGSRIHRSVHGTHSDEQIFAAGYYLDVTPSYDSATHKLGDIPTWDEVSGTVAMNVIERAAEDLAAELAAKIEQMDNAVRSHIDKHAHWTGGLKAQQKAQAGKPKALAVFAWAEQCWGLFWQRKDALLAGTLAWSDALLDFPPAPHTMREVAEE